MPTTSLQFREIGKGQCGSIWAVDAPGSTSAFKRQHQGHETSEYSRSVTKDSAMHQRIEHSFTKCRKSLGLRHLNIPEYRQLVYKDDIGWWDMNKSRFPTGSEPCNTLISERILPLDLPVRTKIIERYCPEKIKNVVTNSRKDEDCLVRPYLGRRSRDARPSPFFTLRNKALTMNQMQELGLPAAEYARAMADALALMFWHARVDANDVEFVLAPKGSHPDSGSWHSEVLGEHTLWLLDFDCVEEMNMDESGIAQAASAFFRNDPYYPRPSGENELDRHLWTAFVQRFLESSRVILGESTLPRMMVDKLEEIGKDRRSKRL